MSNNNKRVYMQIEKIHPPEPILFLLLFLIGVAPSAAGNLPYLPIPTAKRLFYI